MIFSLLCSGKLRIFECLFHKSILPFHVDGSILSLRSVFRLFCAAPHEKPEEDPPDAEEDGDDDPYPRLRADEDPERGNGSEGDGEPVPPRERVLGDRPVSQEHQPESEDEEPERRRPQERLLPERVRPEETPGEEPEADYPLRETGLSEPLQLLFVEREEPEEPRREQERDEEEEGVEGVVGPRWSVLRVEDYLERPQDAAEGGGDAGGPEEESTRQDGASPLRRGCDGSTRTPSAGSCARSTPGVRGRA